MLSDRIEELAQAPTMTPAELRAAREAKGWTQTHLGAVVGVHLRTVRRWETGESPISPAMARWLRAEYHDYLVRAREPFQDNAMLRGERERAEAVADAAAQNDFPTFLPVLKAAVAYVEARKAVYGEGAGSLKWNELRTIMHDKHDALVAAVEEARDD